jgi:phage-related protein
MAAPPASMGADHNEESCTSWRPMRCNGANAQSREQWKGQFQLLNREPRLTLVLNFANNVRWCANRLGYSQKENAMPEVEVLIYRDDKDGAPLIDWLESLPTEARNRCVARLTLLHQRGRELRRPHAENLGKGLYELRLKVYRVNYRMLYFFHGREAVVVSHGFAKEGKIPDAEIELALERMARFAQDPRGHTFHPEE